MKNLYLKLNDEFKEFVIDRNEFTDMIFGTEGVKYKLHFPNGYGASVIKICGSHGYEKDLWELALLTNRDGTGKWTLEYTELVNEDTLGYLTDDQVNEIITYIFEGKVHEHVNIHYYDF